MYKTPKVLLENPSLYKDRTFDTLKLQKNSYVASYSDEGGVGRP